MRATAECICGLKGLVNAEQLLSEYGSGFSMAVANLFLAWSTAAPTKGLSIEPMKATTPDISTHARVVCSPNEA